MNRSQSCVALAVGLALAAAAAADPGQTWDATTDFANGAPWSYMQRAGADCSGAATPMSGMFAPTDLSPGPFKGYFGGDPAAAVNQRIPWVIKNLNASGVQNVLGSVDSTAQTLWIHPGFTGPNFKCAVVRFSHNLPGKYHVTGSLRSIDRLANTVRAHIFHNNAQVGQSIALSGPQFSTASFSQLVERTSNGPFTIDFALSDGGHYWNDSIQLDLKVKRCPPGNPPGC